MPSYQQREIRSQKLQGGCYSLIVDGNVGMALIYGGYAPSSQLRQSELMEGILSLHTDLTEPQLISPQGQVTQSTRHRLKK